MAAGFEHSVANMYFIPVGVLITRFDAAFAGGIGIDGKRLPKADSELVQVDAPETAFGLLPGGGSTTYRGTSAATAYLTSLGAVALRANPELTAAQLRDVLVSSASP